MRLWLAISLTLLAVSGWSGEDPAPVATLPKDVTTLKGELGDLLKKWFAEGSAAGNVGDIYDNRDREHSGLNMGLFPQLTKFQYSKEELDRRADWAFFGGVRTGIVFGNSSTSAGAYQGGSNPRQAYANPRGLEVLYRQYTSNNLYIYPEHRDHDPGHNGSNDGYGDLYPTNTPFLLISQGSSGTDQPFMRAVPLMLASLRPDVKRKLAETGQLMAALQMMLRYCAKNLTDPEKEYLTGAAHPTVFEGKFVNDLALAKMAHALTLETLPPQVRLKVVEEDHPKEGVDFFEPGATEVHATLPVLVARIFRGRQYTRKMVVSAEESADPNGKPLKFHWTVLRGDPAKVRITPKNETGSVVEIQIEYHERRPIAPGSNMESNRVDIGAFVHNGTYFSAPAFVTWFFLDHEARTYGREGHILEIGYKTGEVQLGIPDWTKFFAMLEGDAATWPVKYLRDELKDAVPALVAAGKDYAPLVKAASEAEAANRAAQEAVNAANAALKDAEKKRDEARKTGGDATDDAQKSAVAAAEAAHVAADAERKKLEEARRVAEKKRNAAKETAEKFLREKRDGLAEPIQATVEAALRRILSQHDFIVKQHTQLASFTQSDAGKKGAGALAGALEKVKLLGIVKLSAVEAPQFNWIRGSQEQASAFERAMLERCNGEILSQVLFPGVVKADFKVNYVQPEIAEPPAWRDQYFYAEGHYLGWFRYPSSTLGQPGDPGFQSFHPDGSLATGRDRHGRVFSARAVKYEPEKVERDELRKRGWPYWRKTMTIPGDEIRHYTYADTDTQLDWVGKLDRTEKPEAAAPKPEVPVEKVSEPVKK